MKVSVCRKGAGEELTVMVPFMRLVQSRMHGLKKVKKSVMIEPGVQTSGSLCILAKNYEK